MTRTSLGLVYYLRIITKSPAPFWTISVCLARSSIPSYLSLLLQALFLKFDKDQAHSARLADPFNPNAGAMHFQSRYLYRSKESRATGHKPAASSLSPSSKMYWRISLNDRRPSRCWDSSIIINLWTRDLRMVSKMVSRPSSMEQV